MEKLSPKSAQLFLRYKYTVFTMGGTVALRSVNNKKFRGATVLQLVIGNIGCPSGNVQTIRGSREKTAVTIVCVSVIIIYTVIDNINRGMDMQRHLISDVRIEGNNV